MFDHFTALQSKGLIRKMGIWKLELEMRKLIWWNEKIDVTLHESITTGCRLGVYMNWGGSFHEWVLVFSDYIMNIKVFFLETLSILYHMLPYKIYQQKSSLNCGLFSIKILKVGKQKKT